MNSIETKDMERLLVWTENHHLQNDSYDYSKKKDSYYERFDNSNNIQEYSFKNIDELTSLLKPVLDCEELVKICSVTAFKMKPKEETLKNGEEKIKELPDYIYVF